MTSISPGAPLLSVENLSVSLDTPDGMARAVRGISFTAERGKTLAIVGESGSGKTVSALALLGLIPNAHVSGRAMFAGRDLLTRPEKDLRAIRGAEIAMVFQNPHSSLHPNLRIGTQVEEVLRIHTRTTGAGARTRAIELLGRVGIPEAANRANSYPHEFSGGMLQRVMIAMAIALNPKLIIADEPTTALDVTVQAQILKLLRDLQQEFGTALILITHDLGVVAQVADDVMVMYGGRTMEQASAATLFARPHHPYTRGLIASLPRLDSTRERLTPIAGQPPTPLSPPRGCPFHPRCPFAEPRCEQDQPLVPVGDDAGHQSACWLPPGVR